MSNIINLKERKKQLRNVTDLAQARNKTLLEKRLAEKASNPDSDVNGDDDILNFDYLRVACVTDMRANNNTIKRKSRDIRVGVKNVIGNAVAGRMHTIAAIHTALAAVVDEALAYCGTDDGAENLLATRESLIETINLKFFKARYPGEVLRPALDEVIFDIETIAYAAFKGKSARVNVYLRAPRSALGDLSVLEYCDTGKAYEALVFVRNDLASHLSTDEEK